MNTQEMKNKIEKRKKVWMVEGFYLEDRMGVRVDDVWVLYFE